MPAPMRTKQPRPVPTRDPALKQLAAESRSSAEQYADAAPAVRKVRERYAREISSLPEVKTHLDKLKDRDVRPERVLKYLALFVQLEKDGTWQAMMAEKNANLRELADRLQSIANEVERAYDAGANRPDLFAMSLGVPVLPATPYAMGTGDDVATRAGTAEAQPVTYTSTLSPFPPMCSEGMKTSGSGAEPQ